MAGLYVKNAGKWHLPKSIWVKYAGTWRVCNNVYIKHGGVWREMIKTVTLTSNRSNFNLWEYVGRPSQPVSLVFTINSNVVISSARPPLPQWCPYWCVDLRASLPSLPTAFTVGNFPNGSTVIINNNGYISGGGGYGGAGGNSFSKGDRYPYYLYGTNGGNGGHGLVKGSSNSYDCTIVNTGTIAGGGGGGGGAGSYFIPATFPSSGGYSRGGHGGDGAGVEGYSRTQGGNSASNQNNYDKGIDGGQGGAIGENGQAGQSTGQGQQPNGTGGTAGKAIISSGITIAVSGNIDGAIG
jgi:hypothetical protein